MRGFDGVSAAALAGFAHADIIPARAAIDGRQTRAAHRLILISRRRERYTSPVLVQRHPISKSATPHCSGVAVAE